MNSGKYIWQQPDWAKWEYDSHRLAPALAKVHLAQGHLLGRMHDIGMGLRDEATLQVLTEDVIKTSEIEGEHLNPETCLLYTSPSPRDKRQSRMPSSA